jgi:hypothetical protein
VLDNTQAVEYSVDMISNGTANGRAEMKEYRRILIKNSKRVVYLENMYEAEVLGHECVGGVGVDRTGEKTGKTHIIDKEVIANITVMEMSKKYCELLAVGE